MNADTLKAVAKLIEYKKLGKSYYEAANLLRKQGYSEAQLSDASNLYDYNDPDFVKLNINKDSLKNKTSAKDSIAHDKHYQELGNRILAEKERGGRLFVYTFMAIAMGLFGYQFAIFYINNFTDEDMPNMIIYDLSSYSETLNSRIGWGLFIGFVFGSVTTIALRVYFRHQDMLYKRIERDIDIDKSKKAAKE